MDELVDLQNVRLWCDEIRHLVIADRVHEAFGLHFYFEVSRPCNERKNVELFALINPNELLGKVNYQ